ncbi:phage tail sheath subtilisin-like domain-containing protein [Streptomyces griseorubiginosus]|uniref:phage tail sheath family protein n=1 Tax=Streptomyces griseorubiginosus TaxID=67304 RepID=UPI0036E21286
MPEYLTPGVYVEETSFRSKTIEGVSTSTCGMAGLTRYGPVAHTLTFTSAAGGDEVLPVPVAPPLLTSFADFERAFGGVEDLESGPGYLALSARAFFANGGRRLYVARVFPWFRSGTEVDVGRMDECFATRAVGAGSPPVAQWRARWPGRAGRAIKVDADFQRGKNVLVRSGDPVTVRLTGVRVGSLVELAPPGTKAPGKDVRPAAADLRVVVRDPADGELKLQGRNAPELPTDQWAFPIRLSVTATLGSRRIDVYNDLAVDERSARYICRVLDQVDPADEFSLVWLRVTGEPTPAELLEALLLPASSGFLTGGSDGDTNLRPDDFKGQEADPANASTAATGLEALAGIEDIAVVAMPDTVRWEDPAGSKSVVDHLIGHCERLRYRIAVVDPPKESSLSQVREFRALFDSKYGALYYPWVKILDPNTVPEPGTPTATVALPPSGFVAGIYARSDVERGVYKAPANEVVRGITEFEIKVNHDQQAVLNPEGINALRFFEGRSNRVWGARTMTSDPEWKYVNVRRLFIYLEHSIEKATQWAVFEPNNPRLWASVRQSIEDFLLVVWRSGALMGTRPEEAYFVRCDRTTMSQNDLDNGRLICLIGVAPTCPAEFVIFRVGQWTADAQRS